MARSSKLKSDGTGNAGNVTIKAGNQFAMTDSTISTSAAFADGGNIEIRATNMVRHDRQQRHLVRSAIRDETEYPSGGNVTIDPQLVILQNSQIPGPAPSPEAGVGYQYHRNICLHRGSCQYR